MTTILWLTLALIVAVTIASHYYCRKRIAHASQQLKAARIAYLNVLRREVYNVNLSINDFIYTNEYHEIRYYQDPEERRAFETNKGTPEDLYVALDRMQRIWGVSDKDICV